MDGLSGKLRFRSEQLHFDMAYAPFREEYQLLLGMVGTFRITLNHAVMFEEPEFPVIEFAVQLTSWFPDGLRTKSTFVYTSMESEVKDFLWFKYLAGNWRIGSDFAPFPLDVMVSENDLEIAIGDFRGCLLQNIPIEMRKKVLKLIEIDA